MRNERSLLHLVVILSLLAAGPVGAGVVPCGAFGLAECCEVEFTIGSTTYTSPGGACDVFCTDQLQGGGDTCTITAGSCENWGDSYCVICDHHVGQGSSPAKKYVGGGSRINVICAREDAGPSTLEITAASSALSNWIDTGNSDSIVHGAPNVANYVRGGSGNDTITTGGAFDFVNAGDGDNVITTAGGNDRIAAGSGDDDVDAGNGDDQIAVGDGVNTVLAGAGNDVISGGAGKSIIDAGDGNDAVGGGIGDDVVRGGKGNDTIVGGGGRDLLYGDDGDDLVLDSLAPVPDGSLGSVFCGGAGNDVLVAQGPSHQCLDPGSGQTQPPPGFTNDCYYEFSVIGRDVSQKIPFDVGTGIRCAAPTTGVETARMVECGCP